MPVQRIVPMGGGEFRSRNTARNARFLPWLLGLARRTNPRVLFVPTASGDSPVYIRQFYRTFRRFPCRPDHLPLFNRTGADLHEQITSSDVIYTGGGNTANMLLIWRLHGVDSALREALENGTVLCGPSAGAICWFQCGVTDSFGPDLQPLKRALGFLAGSFCPHYDGELQRRPAFHRFVSNKQLTNGYAADDDAAILFENGRLADVVKVRPHAAAYHVERRGGGVVESVLPARLLARGHFIRD